MLPKLTRDKPNWWAQSAPVLLAPPLQEQLFNWSSVGGQIEGWNFVIPWYDYVATEVKSMIWALDFL